MKRRTTILGKRHYDTQVLAIVMMISYVARVILLMLLLRLHLGAFIPIYWRWNIPTRWCKMSSIHHRTM